MRCASFAVCLTTNWPYENALCVPIFRVKTPVKFHKKFTWNRIKVHPKFKKKNVFLRGHVFEFSWEVRSSYHSATKDFTVRTF